MLTVENLNLTLNQQPILQAVSLTVPNGIITSLIGPSGAGKSSLLRCIAGFMPCSGQIMLNDRPLENKPTARRNLGYVEQDNTLLPHLSVAENIMYPLRLRHRLRAEMQRQANVWLQQFHINHLAQRLPHQLSGGEQRRVMLARTLIYDPSLLLFDEPFAGVDTLARVELVKLLKELLPQRAIPVLYVTHDLAEAQYISPTTIIMRHGLIETQSTWAQLQQSNQPWLQTFLQQHF